MIDLPGGQGALVASQPIAADGGGGRAIQGGRSLAPIRDDEREAALVIAVASGVATVLSLLGGWVLAGRALSRIREALLRQQEFTADASHELRTPLAVLDSGIQMMQRHPEETVADNAELLDSMRDEANRMRRLVESLLALARADAGQTQLRLAAVDVGALLPTVVRDLAALAGPREIQLVAEGGLPLIAEVDADRIKQLLIILVDNAIRCSPPDAQILLRGEGHDRQIALEVSDHGPGIPAKHRARVLEGFTSTDLSRTGVGAGLGLSIAQWITTAHHGSITLADNHPGLRVRVELPLRTPDTAPARRHERLLQRLWRRRSRHLPGALSRR